MKISKLHLLFTLVFIGQFTAVLAQRNFSTYHLEGAPQNHHLNPSFKPNSKINVSLPIGFQSFGFSHSGFKLDDLLQERPQDDSLEINPQGALDAMQDLNHLSMESINEIIGFGFRLKKNYFSFSVVNRLKVDMLYTQDLFTLAIEGNGGELLGQRASLDDLKFNMNSYVEYNFGYNREINERLTVGGRLKLLSGIANIQTQESRMGLTTDAETFDLSIDGSLSVNSSNVSRLFVEEVNGTDTTVNLPIKNAYNFVNSGFGLDLGASYKVNDKLSLSASLLDLGIINWKDDAQNYTSNDIDYSFRGINIEGFLQDSLDVFDELVDSLNTVFEQDENNNAYSTSLQTRFYLGGRYELTKWLDVTGLFFSEVINKKYRGALHVGANAKVNQWLSATLNYGYYGRSWSNVGIGLSLRGGPVQFFLSIDNIMVGVVPLNQRNLHFATGLTLLFGKPDKAKKSKELALK